jgi:hypothetical protein
VHSGFWVDVVSRDHTRRVNTGGLGQQGARKINGRDGSIASTQEAVLNEVCVLGLADVLENADNALTPMMRNMIDILWDEWKTVEQQIEELTISSNRSLLVIHVAAASVRSQASALSSQQRS